ncbi:amphi-Trp domain-containing protein [Allorhizocola rhizosphaerae]|uniref:amphi-Trp domain-containing protein n=1 Tax=Allorhizocola rhizosphaerae TaxID=1872709 RepID=UPI0013C2EFA8|nr:amphi-Trp domain-containing protein [Allorhizocola rhizosphaerae]
MEIFEDERTVSRADLAAWLRQMAGQLELDGKVMFGAAGAVTVGDEVHCELEIESSGSKTSIEIEFSWTGAGASGTVKDSKAEADEDEGEEEEDEESEGEEESEAEAEGAGDVGEERATLPAVAGVAPAVEPGDSAEEDKGGDARPTAAAH